MERKKVVPLSRLAKGKAFLVREIRDRALECQALELGLAPGSKGLCLGNLPAGPIILGLGMQKIALGRGFAGKIFVEEGENQ